MNEKEPFDALTGTDFQPNNIVGLDDFDKKIKSQNKRLARLKDSETIFRVRDWTSEHKTITIVGTATAIGLALSGLYALKKHRRN